MRIGGIASGMDTEQMIKELMNAERVRVNKYYRQEESIKWKQEALNTTNKTLAEFILKARSGFGLTSTSSTGSILNKTIDSLDWVKKVSSSNESIVKATATNEAMEGKHTIEVEQLADVARFTSGKLNLKNSRFTEEGSFTISNGTKSETIEIKKAEVIGKEITDFDFTGDKSLTLLINNKEIKLDKDFTNVTDDSGNPISKEEALVQHIQTALTGTGITVGINADGELNFKSVDPIIIESTDVVDGSEPPKLKLEQLGLENGMVKGNNSINDIIKKINDSDLGLRAAYDSKLGKLMITSKVQGSDQKIDFSGTLHSIFTTDSAYKSGEDAVVKFNDQPVENLKSNNFSLYGINFQLQSAKKNEKITINVESNVDGVMEKVKGFVEEYNTLIDVLNGLLKEKNYRDYTPLLSEEKEAMKDREIELWEAKAKSGLLRNDESITRMLQNMRTGLYQNVYENGYNEDGTRTKLSGFNHITQIGITTGNYQSGGRLEIDEAKLRQAIIDNPDGVINLLFKKSDITSVKDADGKINKDKVTEKRGNSGLIERLFDDMISGMQDIVKRSGTGDNASLYRSVQYNMLIDFVTSGSISLLDKDITSVGTRIAREESLLTSKETRYWKQFTAMEKAMQKMNSQGSWLAAQLGQR
ncbi:flagellar filament capping protein FliD [Alkaliphilus sp. MSJ-5]|uniref:Flagellar hook-associated protein 2 n=1 Tax=Alkaliphilus flagellatus TaxID=2841507 RepID=A0ABS6G2V5_9FIRM|nr:flagellar filament capping protein FliD [Alkaliphilus flagellatus]MBU5676694.1 flagellar filament capping protein FliD [Alkaliphilus flagellatus]